MFEFLKNEKVSIFFSTLMMVICGVSYYIDMFCTNDIYWFQRSGALIVLAAVELQYSKITSLWKNGGYFMGITSGDLDPEIPDHAKKINGMNPIEKAALDLSVRNHEMITNKSYKDTMAVVMIILGTCVWAYGDLPFRT